MISEIDLKDFDQENYVKLPFKQKIYELPRDTFFLWMDKVFNFKKVDGMYSHCTDSFGSGFQFAAFTEVTPLIKKKDIQ